MNNFKFRNPTELIFGKGMVSELSKRVPQSVPVLITFGGGSVKKNGVYDAVKEALKNHNTIEFWGIEANPKVETLRKAIELGREHNVGFILAVGGGSVIDGSKLIAGAILSDMDAWDLVKSHKIRNKTIPLGTVLTIPATGSEMNNGGVISCLATKEKFAFAGEFPIFSILDPEYTYSLPEYQVSCGIADTFVHTLEQYLTVTGQSRLMDRWAESLMLTLTEIAPIIRQDPQNYDARAEMMLCSTMALNGFIAMGVSQDWATHGIGHELTALTGITHGHTLSIVMPGTMRVLGYGQKRGKMLQYAERVWGITEGEENTRITQAIEKTEDFFRSLGLKTRLEEMEVSHDVILEIEKRFAERGVKMGENMNIESSISRQILESVYPRKA